MNEELQGRIAGYLDAVESSANAAGGFVAEQAPLVAQEYLAWVFWQAAIVLAVACVGMLVAVAFAALAFSTRKGFENVDSHIGATMAALILVVCSVIFGGAAVHDLVKVKVAPRIVLLEKSAELVNQVKP